MVLSIYRLFPRIYSRTRFVNSLAPQGKVLDVGCGPGEFQQLIKPLRPRWVFEGTDIARHPQLDKNVYFFKSDFNKKINCKDNTYDAVVCTHVFEHLANTDVAIKEIFRVLRPGGVLYIETPSNKSVHYPAFHFINSRDPVPINFYDDPTHIRPFSPPGLARLCQSAGFSVVKVGYARNWLAVMTSPITFVLAFLTGKRSFLVHSLWHTFGWAAYAVARKPKK